MNVAAPDGRSETRGAWPGTLEDMSVLKPAAALEEIRREIDAIDDAIADLLVRRFAATARVRDAKSNDGSIAASPLRPAREASLLRRLIQRSEGKLSPEFLVRLWRVILSSSTLAQAPVTLHIASRDGERGVQLRLLLERHFCGMSVRLHGSESEALAALAASRGDLAVLSTVSDWAATFAGLSKAGLRVIGSLPQPAPNRIPDCLIFGFSEPPQTGEDETLVLCKKGDGVPAGVQLWSAQSGGWTMVSLDGYLDMHSTGQLLAGRYPCPIEVSP